MMSSQYGPYKLGHTGATMVITKGSNDANRSKTQKNYLRFRLFSAIREHEGGIASNRKKACYGEFVSRLSTHRPSRHGNWFIENEFFN
jgi:hypothetical protein